jgi:hypothetical protein
VVQTEAAYCNTKPRRYACTSPSSAYVTQILIRLEYEEPVLRILDELGIARNSIYHIRDNLIAFGTPYPPAPSMRADNPRILSDKQVEVYDRNEAALSVEFTLIFLPVSTLVPRRLPYYSTDLSEI